MDEQLDLFGGSVPWEEAGPLLPPKDPKPEMTEVIIDWMREWGTPASTHEITERFDKLGIRTSGIPAALIKLRKEKLIAQDTADLDPSAPSLKSGYRWHVL